MDTGLKGYLAIQVIIFTYIILFLKNSNKLTNYFASSNLYLINILLIFLLLILYIFNVKELRKKNEEVFASLYLSYMNFAGILIIFLKLASKSNMFLNEQWINISTIIVVLVMPVLFFRLSRQIFLKIEFVGSLRFFILFFILGWLAIFDSDLLNSIFVIVYVVFKRIITDNKEIENNDQYKLKNKNFITDFITRDSFPEVFFALLYISVFLSSKLGIGKIAYGPYNLICDWQLKLQFSVLNGFSIIIFMSIFLTLYNTDFFVSKLIKYIYNFSYKIIDDLNKIFKN